MQRQSNFLAPFLSNNSGHTDCYFSSRSICSNPFLGGHSIAIKLPYYLMYSCQIQNSFFFIRKPQACSYSCLASKALKLDHFVIQSLGFSYRFKNVGEERKKDKKRSKCYKATCQGLIFVVLQAESNCLVPEYFFRVFAKLYRYRLEGHFYKEFQQPIDLFCNFNKLSEIQVSILPFVFLLRADLNVRNQFSSL